MSVDYPATMPRPANVTTLDISAAKQVMRAQAVRKRDSIYRDFSTQQQAGLMLRESFLSRCPLPSGAIIAGYSPINDEIDVRPLMHALADRGHSMAMPVVMSRQQPMRFRHWYPGMHMASGRFGIPTPPDNFPMVRPDVVLVPLLAFDRQGYRLGRGSGFYDHTLELLRSTGKVIAIGIAFAGQEVPSVPRDAFDQRLDWVVTENYAFASQNSFNPINAFGSLS